MIHHISIAVDHPLRVAEVLVELLNGKIIPFPSNPGSYVALAFDAYGTLIEVHPRGMELRPGVGKNAVRHQVNPHPSAYTATHAAISVLVSETGIRSIAAREGWSSAMSAAMVSLRSLSFGLKTICCWNFCRLSLRLNI